MSHTCIGFNKYELTFYCLLTQTWMFICWSRLSCFPICIRLWAGWRFNLSSAGVKYWPSSRPKILTSWRAALTSLTPCRWWASRPLVCWLWGWLSLVCWPKPPPTPQSLRRLGYGLQSAHQVLQLWQGTLKEIGGTFGSSVLSYFLFLKWLLLFNLFSFLVNFGFITIPLLVFDPSPNVPANVSFRGLELLTGAVSSNSYLSFSWSLGSLFAVIFRMFWLI